MKYEEYQHLLFERRGDGILLVTINRPDVLNAIDDDVLDAFAVSGDGGAMYSIAELATARQHDADVTWLIVDDGGYGILREYMTDAFGQATATELSRPDFAALAASFGIPAHVATLDTVGEIVAGTFTAPGPAVVVLPALLRMFSPTHL